MIYHTVMVECLVSSKIESEDNWFDEISALNGVKEITRDLRYLLIEISLEMISKLQKQFPNLIFDEIFILPKHKELKKP